MELTAPERQKHPQVLELIQSNAKPGRHDKDAFHLVESAKYGKHFITKDGRLLKKASEIWCVLQLKVVKPSEFLPAYRHHVERHSS